MGGEGIPVVSLGEPHANTEQQIMSQEEAEKLSTELQCSLKWGKRNICFTVWVPILSEREFLVQRCGFPSQEAQEAISNRLQKS